MDKKLQQYLIAIDVSNILNEHKLYLKLKALFVFDFIENGTEDTLNELENLYNSVKKSKTFNKEVAKCTQIKQHIQQLLIEN